MRSPSRNCSRVCAQPSRKPTAPSERLTDIDLLEKRRIQVFDVTLLQAIYHCVEHFSGHTGQIIWAAKAASGQGLGFYDYLKDPSKAGPDLQP